MQAPGKYQWEAGNLNPEEWAKWVGKLRKGAYVPHMKNPFPYKLPKRFKEFLASVDPLNNATELTRAEMRKIVDEYILKSLGINSQACSLAYVFIRIDEPLARLFGSSVNSEVYNKDIDTIMDGMFTEENTHVTPEVRVCENAAAYMIAVDLVGCKREHITASVVDGNRLHVQAKRVLPRLEGGLTALATDPESLQYVLVHKLPFECKKAPVSLFADGVLTLTFDKEATYQSIPIVIG